MPVSAEELHQLAQEFVDCRRVLAALGDANRQHLLLEMMQMAPCSGVRVGEITQRTHLSRPAVSHHLKILKEGLPDGISPMATDTAVVAYKGLLINKTVFDGSYDNNFMDDFTQATYRTALSAVINGWTTALLHMREGERVELYIPANLGYGTTAKETIPANSTLCFELYLDKVVHPKGPDDRSLTEVMEEE